MVFCKAQLMHCNQSLYCLYLLATGAHKIIYHAHESLKSLQKQLKQNFFMVQTVTSFNSVASVFVQYSCHVYLLKKKRNCYISHIQCVQKNGKYL